MSKTRVYFLIGVLSLILLMSCGGKNMEDIEAGILIEESVEKNGIKFVELGFNESNRWGFDANAGYISIDKNNGKASNVKIVNLTGDSYKNVKVASSDLNSFTVNPSQAILGKGENIITLEGGGTASNNSTIQIFGANKRLDGYNDQYGQVIYEMGIAAFNYKLHSLTFCSDINTKNRLSDDDKRWINNVLRQGVISVKINQVERDLDWDNYPSNGLLEVYCSVLNDGPEILKLFRSKIGTRTMFHLDMNFNTVWNIAKEPKDNKNIYIDIGNSTIAKWERHYRNDRTWYYGPVPGDFKTSEEIYVDSFDDKNGVITLRNNLALTHGKDEYIWQIQKEQLGVAYIDNNFAIVTERKISKTMFMKTIAHEFCHFKSVGGLDDIPFSRDNLMGYGVGTKLRFRQWNYLKH